jgi:diaminopimelate epimerase
MTWCGEKPFPIFDTMEFCPAMIKLENPIPFFKMTGSGNDFIIIDNRSHLIDADRCQDLVRFACRRKLSAGADGLILIENDGEFDFRWRFYNADGSEAEMCGNGARCAARFAYLNGIVRHRKMAFRTIAGIIRGEIIGNRVKVRMTSPHSLKEDISVEVENQILSLHFIDTGVPHVVHFVSDKAALEMIDVPGLGRALRFHPQFQPAGANVNFAVLLDTHHMAVRTYERGVEDETLACGTGSIASTLVAAAGKRVKSPVDVLTQSAETLTIHFEQEGEKGLPQFAEVYLEGDAKVVYEAKLWDETLA